MFGIAHTLAYSTEFCPFGPGCCGKCPTKDECDPDGYCPDMYWADFPFNACSAILNPNVSNLCNDCVAQSSASGTCSDGSCSSGSLTGAELSGLIGITGASSYNSRNLQTPLANTPPLNKEPQLISMGGKVVFFLPEGRMANIAPFGGQAASRPISDTSSTSMASAPNPVRLFRISG